MVAEAMRGRPRTVRSLSVGAFGWQEIPDAIEICPQEDCIHGMNLTTDLYCTAHDRFLPYVRNWSNGRRAVAIVGASLLVYGCFALAAQLDSWAPLFLVYAAAGLGIVVLPLRLFRATTRVTAFLWLFACVLAGVYRMSGSRVRELIVASVVMAAASAMSAQCAAFAVRGAKDKRNHVDSDDRAAAVALVAGAA